MPETKSILLQISSTCWLNVRLEMKSTFDWIEKLKNFMNSRLHAVMYSRIRRSKVENTAKMQIHYFDLQSSAFEKCNKPVWMRCNDQKRKFNLNLVYQAVWIELIWSRMIRCVWTWVNKKANPVPFQSQSFTQIKTKDRKVCYKNWFYQQPNVFEFNQTHFSGFESVPFR